MPRTPRNTVLYGAIGQGGYQQKKGSRGEHCREHRGTALTMEACRLNHGSWRGGFPPGTPPSNCIDRSTPRRAKDRAASTPPLGVTRRSRGSGQRGRGSQRNGRGIGRRGGASST